MLLLLALAAAADPNVALAPTVGEVREQIVALEGRLVDADALGEAVARVHNAWAERAGAPGKRAECEGPAADLALRSELFGTPWRDAIQLARVELDEVERAFLAPSAAPLLDERDRVRLAGLRDRTRRHERALIEASSWHQQTIASFIRRCKPVLAPVAGLARSEIRAAGEGAGGAVAVAVIAPGRLCVAPGKVVQGPAVVIVDVPAACYGDCASCVAESVAPGAVLGEKKEP